MKAIILAGGLGTRLREETEYKPKPMVEIGGQPILWHIMKNFCNQGISDFIVAGGYKVNVIKDYFSNLHIYENDLILSKNTRQNQFVDFFDSQFASLIIRDTGFDTPTGGRVLNCKDLLSGFGTFVCTYGDGLADIDIVKLLEFHKRHKKIATFTAVRPLSRFGIAEIEEDGLVTSFKEKPQIDGWVNGGFFVFEHDIFERLTPNSILENEPLDTLVKDGELMAYRHSGFWQPMDTYRETMLLNDVWSSNQAPWKNW
jgi:glucose-1-phosphate cytidylyltransferase